MTPADQRAVIADGAAAARLGDEQIVAHGLSPVFVSETWLTMRSIELVSAEAEPRRRRRSSATSSFPCC